MGKQNSLGLNVQQHNLASGEDMRISRAYAGVTMTAVHDMGQCTTLQQLHGKADTCSPKLAKRVD